MNSSRFPVALLLCSAFVLLAGCTLLPTPQPDRTRHYVLESGAAVATPTAQPVRLGLRNVEIPAYLKTKAMVVRSGNNEIRYNDTARWAEPLEAGITRLLRERLAGRARIITYPFPANLERDYDVTVRVLSAEGHDRGVLFSAVVELTRVGDTATIVSRRVYTAPVVSWNGDFAQLASQLSAAVANLADEVLAAVPQE
ncbi:MAG: PqiC family protein [Candidatus Didemnitutus sp.]|nr:PqiC family protein [Candidatus Didemnitutus sp.]